MATTYTVKCIGPGPHDANCAADGTFGVSAEPVPTWRCTAAVCQPPTAINLATMQQRLAAGLTADLAFVNAAKPGTAALQASAAYDQAVRCARQNIALIRIALGQLDDTSGT